MLKGPISVAFTLVEMLVVMAIISILVGLAVKAFGSHGNDQDMSLIQIGDALESARQVAISQNTYTYVGFTSPTNIQNIDTPLCIAVFQSRTGADVVHDALLGTPLGDDSTPDQMQWQPVRRATWLKNIFVDSTSMTPDDGLVPPAELTKGKFSNTPKTLPNGLNFKLTGQFGSMTKPAAVVFDRTITFSPDGAAYIDNATKLPEALIGFQITPSRGVAPTAKEKLLEAAVTIGGLLGNTQTFKLGSN